eukprot:gb/GEZN01001226.1/.p1 GENE.gb/GEZN01001226.1/~~gb/GEZN01001226.1/.p1  ORF type:complete len:531 (-),score=62.97 gb/GEZN01001226.1/:1588-3180(-)
MNSAEIIALVFLLLSLLLLGATLQQYWLLARLPFREVLTIRRGLILPAVVLTIHNVDPQGVRGVLPLWLMWLTSSVLPMMHLYIFLMYVMIQMGILAATPSVSIPLAYKTSMKAMSQHWKKNLLRSAVVVFSFLGVCAIFIAMSGEMLPWVVLSSRVMILVILWTCCIYYFVQYKYFVQETQGLVALQKQSKANVIQRVLRQALVIRRWVSFVILIASFTFVLEIKTALHSIQTKEPIAEVQPPLVYVPAAIPIIVQSVFLYVFWARAGKEHLIGTLKISSQSHSTSGGTRHQTPSHSESKGEQISHPSSRRNSGILASPSLPASRKGSTTNIADLVNGLAAFSGSARGAQVHTDAVSVTSASPARINAEGELVFQRTDGAMVSHVSFASSELVASEHGFLSPPLESLENPELSNDGQREVQVGLAKGGKKELDQTGVDASELPGLESTTSPSRTQSLQSNKTEAQADSGKTGADVSRLPGLESTTSPSRTPSLESNKTEAQADSGKEERIDVQEDVMQDSQSSTNFLVV